ncbi:MAG: flippase-like domain-containing protein [Candidatus Hydrogenedentes bacterium]|nr:flippase-like domain-containing protein [Candidatus Hydrogenedentota bacterium]
MKRKVWALISAVVAVGLVWLLFHNTDWAQLAAALGSARAGWLLLSQVPIWLSFFTRIQRWGYIVRAVKPDTSFRSMFSATQIAFLANFTVAMRIGEVVRAVVLSRLARIPFSKSFALATLDRVADLIGLIVVVFITVLAFRPAADLVLSPGTVGNSEPYTIPANLITIGAEVTTVALIAVIGGLVLLYLNQRIVLRLTERCLGIVSVRIAAWACRMLHQFADGLHVFRSAGDMAKASAFSLITWACFLWAGVCFFKAFDIDCPWYTVFVMQSLLAFAVSLPGVPGMLGQFHLPIIVTLVMVADSPVAKAQAVAILAHLLNLIPVALAGVYCLFRENLSLVALSRDTADAEEALHREPLGEAPGPD